MKFAHVRTCKDQESKHPHANIHPRICLSPLSLSSTFSYDLRSMRASRPGKLRSQFQQRRRVQASGGSPRIMCVSACPGRHAIWLSCSKQHRDGWGAALTRQNQNEKTADLKNQQITPPIQTNQGRWPLFSFFLPGSFQWLKLTTCNPPGPGRKKNAAWRAEAFSVFHQDAVPELSFQCSWLTSHGLHGVTPWVGKFRLETPGVSGEM